MSRGISRSIAGVVIVLIIASTAAAGYYLLSGPAPATSSTHTASISSSSSSATPTSTSTSQSTASTTSSSFTTSTVISTTCPTTSTTSSSVTTLITTTSTTTPPQTVPWLVNQFGNFSAMSVTDRFSGSNSTSGASYSGSSNDSYTVLYSPTSGASAYKATFSHSATYATQNGTIWIQPDGVVIAVYTMGQNFTGDQAFKLATGLLTFPFNEESTFSTYPQEYFAGNPNVHQINMTTVKLGPTTMTVTNYGLTSPFSTCLDNGFAIVYNAVQIQRGTVPGTTMILVTIRDVTNTFYANGGQLHGSDDIRITSVTKA